MPDLSNVDTDRILAAVSQLDGAIEGIGAQVGKFTDAVQALDKGWTSGVKAEFITRFERDWQAMQEMLAQYHEISSQLREAAQDMEKTESEMLSGVAALG